MRCTYKGTHHEEYILDGDTRMVFLPEAKEGKPGGIVQDTTGFEIARINSVDLGETKLTVYFSAGGYVVAC